VINGAHVVIYSQDAQADRAFFRDVLGWKYVDAGDGWLIFAAPPAELAMHPTEPGSGHHELMLMCADLDTTIAELTRRGAEFTQDVTEQRWGRVTALRLPGGGDLALYQPHHPRPSGL
jgi:catechol 2,3-dioxygenase-like lactoylglutathione lyase family enzyme